MKKKTAVMTVLVSALAIVSLAAAVPRGMDIDLSMSAGTNYMTLAGTDFNVSIEPEVSVYFDGNNGVNARLGWTHDGGNTMTAGVGYTYKNRLCEDMDLAVKAGFDYTGSFMENSSRHGYGMYFGADVSVNFLEDWFLSVGFRDTMEFAHTSKVGDLPSVTEGDFNNLMTLPRVAVGYTF